MSLDAEEACDNIQHPFRLKILGRSGIQRPYLNIVKSLYSKSVANIKLNVEILEAIPIKSGTRQGYGLSQKLFNIVFHVLAWAKTKKGGQRNTNWKGRSQNVMIYRQYDTILNDPKSSTRELLSLINIFSKVAEYKISSNKSVLTQDDIF